MRRVRAIIVAVEKQLVLRILSVCFLGLGMRHAMRMRRIVICGLPDSAIISSVLFGKRSDFGTKKNVIGRKMRILILSATFVRYISHAKKNSVRYDHKCNNGVHETYRLFVSNFDYA